MKKQLSNSKSTDVVVVGSIAFDTLETPFGKISKALGGSASYFSLSAGNFCKPHVVGIVGSDFPDTDFTILKKGNADTGSIEKAAGKTFHWQGKYHFDLNTRDTIKTELGVFANFKPVLNVNLKNAEYIFLGNIHPSLQLSVLKQIKKPKLVGLDTMNLWIETALPDLKKVISLIDIFIINDSEARQLSKEHNIYKAAKIILKMMGHNKNSVLVIKRGEYGLLLFKKTEVFHLPGLPIEDVIDPTGAGDSFAGGFFGYLALKRNANTQTLRKACLYGTAMASLCVENFGTKKLQNVNKNKIESRIKLLQKLVKI
ncbi:MAG: sugar kinase [Candidatus Doudnabacteria bacterium]|nr:sugar kinase [Candidatus Doudnabacteria bacterium]